MIMVAVKHYDCENDYIQWVVITILFKQINNNFIQAICHMSGSVLQWRHLNLS